MSANPPHVTEFDPDSIDTHDLFMAAIQGMIHAADPHSFVIPAARLAPERERDLEAGRLVPVPVDDEGLRVDVLERRLVKPRNYVNRQVSSGRAERNAPRR